MNEAQLMNSAASHQALALGLVETSQNGFIFQFETPAKTRKFIKAVSETRPWFHSVVGNLESFLGMDFSRLLPTAEASAKTGNISLIQSGELTVLVTLH